MDVCCLFNTVTWQSVENGSLAKIRCFSHLHVFRRNKQDVDEDVNIHCWLNIYTHTRSTSTHTHNTCLLFKNDFKVISIEMSSVIKEKGETLIILYLYTYLKAALIIVFNYKCNAKQYISDSNEIMEYCLNKIRLKGWEVFLF